ELFGIHPHGEAEEADQDDRNDGHQRNEGPGHAAAWDGLADAVLSAAENLFKIRLLAAGSRGARAPGATAAALPTSAPALIAPRHDETSSRYVVKGGAKRSDQDTEFTLALPEIRLHWSSLAEGVVTSRLLRPMRPPIKKPSMGRNQLG